MSAKPVLHVVAAVIERSGTYFLAQRALHKTQGGLWEFPGGKVEAGEDPRLALQRELVEELDARGVVVGPCIGMSDFDYGDKVVRLAAHRVQCDIDSLRCIEHASAAWVHPSAMRELALAPADWFVVPLLAAEIDAVMHR